MARYIDADALGIGKADRNAFEIPQYADGWNSAIEIIANAPTADVAPRAEVAMEIFEEIERFLKNQESISENKRLKEVGDWIFHDYLPTQLAVLKKKYTAEPPRGEV